MMTEGPGVAESAMRELDQFYAGLPPEEQNVGGTRGPLAPARLTTVSLAGTWTLSVRDRLRSHVVLDGGLVLAGADRRRDVDLPGAVVALPDGARPTLPLLSRSFVDDDGAACITVTFPTTTRRGRGGVSVLQRTREVRVAGAGSLVWSVLRHLDGERTVAEILDRVPDPREGGRLLAALANLGAVDAYPRPIGRFVHGVTRRGSCPAEGLSRAEIARLVTDGRYRRHPGAPRTRLPAQVPPELAAFHALTRARRSPSHFGPGPIELSALAGVLNTACGVTGALEIEGRELRLRAYPSGGALYAVETYPAVLDVDGLAAGVYHYIAADDCLELLRPGVGRAELLDAALPAQRLSVEGAAVAVCLTGVFSRYERKYGEGGYRILAAEAGHLAQNVILAATALGLGARPVGGFFDDLLNGVLGLDTDEEQFLLCVLLGQAPRSPTGRP